MLMGHLPILNYNPILGEKIFTSTNKAWGKVLFSEVSRVLFTGGVCLSACSDTTPLWSRPPRTRHHPHGPGTTTPVQCMLGDTVNKRAVCILLECNLVDQKNIAINFIQLILCFRRIYICFLCRRYCRCVS